MPMTFSQKTLAFLKEAARQKDAKWLERNRERYQRNVKEPFAELLAAMDEHFHAKVPHFRFTPRSLSRPMRQPDRAGDKGLYKDFIACPMGPRKTSRFEHPPSLYLSISPAEIFFAAGLYMPSGPQLRAVRTAIQNDPESLAKLLNRKRFKDIFGGLSPDDMTRAPRGFSVAPKYMPLLMKRSFTVRRNFTARELAGKQFTKNVIEAAEAALPFVLWLESAVN